MIADRRVLAVIVPLRSRCSVSLDVCSYNPAREKIVKWSITYNHASNMNSESAKELLKLRNSELVCRHGKRKGM